MPFNTIYCKNIQQLSLHFIIVGGIVGVVAVVDKFDDNLPELV